MNDPRISPEITSQYAATEHRDCIGLSPSAGASPSIAGIAHWMNAMKNSMPPSISTTA